MWTFSITKNKYTNNVRFRTKTPVPSDGLIEHLLWCTVMEVLHHLGSTRASADLKDDFYSKLVDDFCGKHDGDLLDRKPYFGSDWTDEGRTGHFLGCFNPVAPEGSSDA